MTDITDEEKAECAEREVKMRQRVYPRWVADKRMTADKARREIIVMQEIAAEYRAKVPRLL